MAKKDLAEEVTVEEVAIEEELVVETAVDGKTKMIHADGRVAYAHESMVPAYKSGGFKEDK